MKKSKEIVKGGDNISLKTDDVQQAVRELLESWKNQLLDFSKRQQLLFFKALKRASVEIKDERSGEIYRHLVEEQKSFQFLPSSPEIAGLLPPSNEDTDESTEASSDIPPHPIYRSYRREELPDRHVDAFLQTNRSEKELDKSLLALYRKSNIVLRERGYNALFLATGFIHWYEDESSEIFNEAPLILIPVVLERRGSKNPFNLTLYSGEEPRFNPVLKSYAEKYHNLKFPSLQEGLNGSSNVEDAVLDIIEYFSKIADLIHPIPRWEVYEKTVLSIFDFASLVIWEDIRKNEDLFINHNPLIKLAGAQDTEDIQPFAQPEDFDGGRYDELLPLDQFVTVFEADSSQQAVIKAISEGHDLVIQGPPGTGKSQTIANAIAQCIKDEKSVLFVSQKMAALEVVYKRLKKVGLAEACLQLHSREANKKEVLRSLQQALDAEEVKPSSSMAVFQELKDSRDQLNSLVQNLHEPRFGTNWTLYNAIGKYSLLDDCPLPNHLLELEQVKATTLEQFNERRSSLSNTAAVLKDITPPEKHPLRGTYPQAAGLEFTSHIRENATTLYEDMEQLETQYDKIIKDLKLSVGVELNSLPSVFDSVIMMSQSPGDFAGPFSGEQWVQPPGILDDILSTGKTFSTQLEGIRERFVPEILQQDDIAKLRERFIQRGNSILRFTRAEFWRDRSRIRILSREGKPPTKNELIPLLELILAAQKNSQFLLKHNQVGSKFFGHYWIDLERIDWNKLVAISEWAQILRPRLKVLSIPQKVLSRIGDGKISHEKVVKWANDLLNRLKSIALSLEPLAEKLVFDTDFLPDWTPSFEDQFELHSDQAHELRQSIERLDSLLPRLIKVALPEARHRIESMLDVIDQLQQWRVFKHQEEQLKKLGLSAFFWATREQGIDLDHLEPSYRKLFLRQWIDAALPLELQNMTRSRREVLLASFWRSDIKLQKSTKNDVLASWSKRRPKRGMGHSRKSEIGELRHQISLKRPRLPVRTLFKKIPKLLTHLKPCLMMSPFSAAQYLDPKVYQVDVLFFDEASQIYPWNAASALLRAKQVIIAGDSQQLPPTSFFQQIELDLEDEFEEEENPHSGVESILEMGAKYYPNCDLRWHYRSKSESLIAFSNKYFYNNRLVTCPSAWEVGNDRALAFYHISSSIYHNRVNREEAKRVVNFIEEHLRKHPDQSIGIGTMNIPQRDLILDLLEDASRKDPKLDALSKAEPEPLFVKNLENIQGDERDVIVISIVYGPDRDGRISHNFGPINRSGGERRLNVLASRSRESMAVFSSMRSSEIDLRRSKSEGACLLKAFLKYAEIGRFDDVADGQSLGETESDFEESVKKFIESKGYQVSSQVGQSHYRIDLALPHPDSPDEFMLGIECDGASYHRHPTARDRDRLREQILRDHGWQIYRIWSTDWFMNQDVEQTKLLNRIQDAIEECKPHTTPFDVEPTDVLVEVEETEYEIIDNSFEDDLEDQSSEVLLLPLERKEGTTSENEDIDSVVSATEAPDTIEIEIEGTEVQPYKVCPLVQQVYNQKLTYTLVVQIVEDEGPIHFELLCRRLLQPMQMTEVSDSLRIKVREILNKAIDEGILTSAERYFYHSKGKTTFPPRYHENDSWHPGWIAIQEYKDGILHVLHNTSAISKEHLLEKTAQLLGCNSDSPLLRMRLTESLDELKYDGVVVKDDQDLLSIA